MPARRDARPDASPSAAGERVLTWLTIVLLAMVGVQCFVLISPQVYWDVDPRSESALDAWSVLGPAVGAWFGVAAAVLAAGAVAAHVWAGGRVRCLSIVLALVGSVGIIAHFNEHYHTLWRGGWWMSAVMLAIAALHLAEHDRPRRYLAAGLTALLAPLFCRALLYVFVDHPETVRHFHAHEREIIEARGLIFGSPQHLLYVRRLEHPEFTGAFALSNVCGSVVAAMTFLAAAMAVGALRVRDRWACVVATGLTLAGVVTTALTRSRGASVALAITGAVLLVVTLRRRWPGWRRVLPPLAIALIATAIFAVLIRGWIGPPATAAGERSLLFRAMYWDAACRMVHAEPVRVLLRGIGIGPFKDAYLRAKDPLNPEVIASTHNVFIDYIVMLGVAGLAWSALLGGWLWKAARIAGGALANEAPPIEPAVSPVTRNAPNLAHVASLLVGIFGVQALLTYEVFGDPPMFGGWVLGMLGFAGAWAVLSAPARVPESSIRVGLFLAALVLLIHNQIEMTFFQPGGATVAWVILGLAAARSQPSSAATTALGRRLNWVGPIAIAALIPPLIAFAIPLTRQQMLLARATDALRHQRPREAIDSLSEAIRIIPRDPEIITQRADLLLERALATRDVARIDEAVTGLDEAERRGFHDATIAAKRAQALEMKFRVTSAPGAHVAAGDAAVAAASHAIALDPGSIALRMHFARLLWDLERPREAGEQYQRILVLQDDAYLDPAMQLTDDDLQMVTSRATAATRPAP